MNGMALSKRQQQKRQHNLPSVLLFDNFLSFIDSSCSSCSSCSSSLNVCFLGFSCVMAGYWGYSGSIGLWFFSIIMGPGFKIVNGRKDWIFGAGLIFWAWNKKSFVADIGMCITNRLTSSTCWSIFCLRLIGLKQIERKLNLFPCAFPSKQPRCAIPTAKTSTERQLRLPDAQHTSVQSWLWTFAIMWPWMTIYLFIIDTRGISSKSNPFPCRIEPGHDQIE